MGGALVIAGVAACVGDVSGARGDVLPALAQAPPPPPGAVPPNATRVVATVRARAVWPPGSQRGPALPSDGTLYSITLAVEAAAPADPALDSRAVPGMVVESFSADVLRPDLVGRRVRATVMLRGDTRARQWWIADVEVVP